MEKSYTYDTASNRKSMAIKIGTVTELTEIYDYDPLNRLETVSVFGTAQATYAYDANGNQLLKITANSYVESYGYDVFNRLALNERTW
jgi:hypothetical protein